MKSWFGKHRRRTPRHGAEPTLSSGTVAGQQSMAVRRLHLGTGLACLALLLAVGGFLLQRVSSADAALDDALLAARQPALALRLVGLNPEAGQRVAFAATLEELRAANRELIAAAEAEPALRRVWRGPGYNLQARLEDLFARADMLLETDAETPPEALLRDEVLEHIAPGLEAAAEAHRQFASARMHRLIDVLRFGGGVALLLPLGWLLLGLPLEARLRRALATLEWLAARDALTGALTGSAFGARLHALLRQARPGRGVALVALDLDDFRALNGTAGDAAGDAVLKAAARRLRQAAGAQALVARTGSDGFAVALPGVADAAAALAFAERLAGALRAPVPHERQVLHASASAGLAFAPQDGTERGELMRFALAALRQAKHEARGHALPFHVGAAEDRARRDVVLAALAEGDLAGVEPWFQPIVSCASGATLRFEVLARWRHPTLGPIPPGEFLPMAEATGRLALLSAHVRTAALLRLAALDNELGAPGPGLSVNIAAAELAVPGTLASLAEALEGAGIAPGRLTIEVTEDMLAGSGDAAALAALQQIRGLGVRLVLDNFGTGFANLAHLHQFPLDGFKLARGFTAGVGTDPRAEAVIRGVVGLGHGLGVETTAEGVETEAQLAFMRAAGCQLAQGYHIARPMPAEALVGWMAQSRH